MKGNIKYALLDADFIIKTIIVQKEQGDHLLDLLMSDHQYSFVCHQMALEEVSHHDIMVSHTIRNSDNHK